MFRDAYLSKSGTTGGTSNGELLANADLLLFFRGAGVAELVDAADSKSASFTRVGVRVPSPVPFFLELYNRVKQPSFLVSPTCKTYGHLSVLHSFNTHKNYV